MIQNSLLEYFDQSREDNKGFNTFKALITITYDIIHAHGSKQFTGLLILE